MKHGYQLWTPTRLATIVIALAILGNFAVVGQQPADDVALPEGLRFVPPNALAFAHVKVADFLGSDAGKVVAEQLTRSDKVAAGLEKIKAALGLTLRDVESLTLIILTPPFDKDAAGADQRRLLEQMRMIAEQERDRAEAARAADRAVRQAADTLKKTETKPCDEGDCGIAVDQGENWFHPLLVVTGTKAFDRAKVLRFADRDEDGEPDTSLIFLSDRSILLGAPQTLVRYVDDVSKESKQETPLAAALALGKAKHVVTAGAAVQAPLRRMLLMRDDSPRGQLTALYPLLSLDALALTADIGQTATLKVHLYGGNAASVALAEQAAKNLLVRTQLAIEERLANEAPVEGSKFLREIAGDLKQALAGVETQHKGKLATLSVHLEIPPAKLALATQELAGQVQIGNRRLESINNLKQIALAMHNYHDVYRGFPPAGIGNVIGKDGKAMLSWRVAILPFIEQQNLYQQFDLNFPWDHPKNKALIAQMPAIYASPGMKKSAEPGLTHYQVFVGPGTPFEPMLRAPGPIMVGRRMTDIIDGTSNTLMVVEAANPVIWTKPDDIPFDPKKPVPKLGGVFPNGFNAAFCDGAVRFLSNKINEETLRLLIMRNDGMVIPEDQLREPRGGGLGLPGAALKADVPAASDEAPKEAGVRVTGKITYKGKPLSGGQVILRNDQGKHMTSINADGAFEFRDIPPGEYRAAVRAPDGVQLPAQYTDADASPLRLELRNRVSGIVLDLK